MFVHKFRWSSTICFFWCVDNRISYNVNDSFISYLLSHFLYKIWLEKQNYWSLGHFRLNIFSILRKDMFTHCIWLTLKTTAHYFFNEGKKNLVLLYSFLFGNNDIVTKMCVAHGELLIKQRPRPLTHLKKELWSIVPMLKKVLNDHLIVPSVFLTWKIAISNMVFMRSQNMKNILFFALTTVEHASISKYVTDNFLTSILLISQRTVSISVKSKTIFDNIRSIYTVDSQKVWSRPIK